MMTRRLFAGLLTAGGSALASAEGFVSHKVLRRPYRYTQKVDRVPFMLWDAILATVKFGEMKAGQFQASPLRVTVRQEGSEEAALYATVTPRHGETFMLLGVHQMRAEFPATVTIECRNKFLIGRMEVKFMHPPFRRENDMVIYHDPFYGSRPEADVPTFVVPHHRVIYGPGKDVGYAGSSKTVRIRTL